MGKKQVRSSTKLHETKKILLLPHLSNWTTSSRDRQTEPEVSRQAAASCLCLPAKGNNTIGGSKVKRLSGVSSASGQGAINFNTRRQFKSRLGEKWYLQRTLNCPRGVSVCVTGHYSEVNRKKGAIITPLNGWNRKSASFSAGFLLKIL